MPTPTRRRQEPEAGSLATLNEHEEVVKLLVGRSDIDAQGSGGATKARDISIGMTVSIHAIQCFHTYADNYQ